MTSESTFQNKQRINLEIVCDEKFLKEFVDRNAASILANRSELSKQKIKRLMQMGAVWLHRGKQHKRIRKGNISIQKGDRQELFYDEHLLKMKLDNPVLLEDLQSYSIWFKPYGVLSQGTQWGDSHSLLRFAELNMTPQRPSFLIHRLDREACGLMLIAHSRNAAAQLSQIFAERLVEKNYLAIVMGKPEKNDITVNSNIDGKNAISHFKLLNYNGSNNTSLMEANIETGRKHQIRIHLSQINLPIIGDSLYGDKKTTKENMKLCAVSLEFDCPISNRKQNFQLPENYRQEFNQA